MSARSPVSPSLLCLVALAIGCAHAFYIPAVAPIGYKDKADVFTLVNGLHSNTGILPFGYYELPFCRPKVIEQRHEALGELLMGDKIETSLYSFQMNVDAKCLVLPCEAGEKEMDAKKLSRFEKFIEDNYRGYMVLDNLPVFNNGSLVYGGRCKDRSIADSFEWLRGYALGVAKKCHGESTLINNHLHFRIQFHKPTEEDFWVVGFTATPYSIDYATTPDGLPEGCNADFDLAARAAKPLTTNPERTKRIHWTYSVTWVEEPGIRWASRWDSYLHTSFADTNSRIHWFSITNSLLIVLCLLTATFLVLVRALRHDFARYQHFLAAMESGETAQEEGGWKNVHADALRPPARIDDLIVLVSSGVQLFGMGLLTLVFALLGFLSPSNRGGLLTALILLYVVQAFVAGYMCARLLKICAEKSWLTITYTAIAIPSVGFSVLLIANITAAHAHASSAVRFVTLMAMLGLWLGISLPLVYLGAAFGFSVPEEKPLSGRPASEPRPIPEQPTALSDWFCILVPGLVPFGALFLELRFILASLWQGMVYYVFGFLSIVSVLWFLCASLITVVIIYYRLSFENYHWWWISFLTPGACGIHIMGYFTYYYFSQLEIHSQSATMVYFLTMGLMALAYTLVAGAIGFLSSFLFIRKIYSTIKMD